MRPKLPSRRSERYLDAACGSCFLCASLLAAPRDWAVPLVRVLDVSDARIGGDGILITDSVGGRAGP
jgi:hypothetical protein